MRVLVATEQHFIRTQENIVYSLGGGEYHFWQRYLREFDEVVVLARVSQSPSGSNPGSRADGDGVRFIDLPDYVGPTQYLRHLPQIRKRVRSACSLGSAFILRVPGEIGNLVWQELRRIGIPYGVEVVGDPFEVFAHGSIRHWLRPYFRWRFTRQLRQICAGAAASAYVTKSALQQDYPPGKYAYTTYYSSVNLPDSSFVCSSRYYPREQNRFHVAFVGTLAQLYKAPDVLIDAVGQCVDDGYDIRLVILGDGRHRQELESRVVRRGIKDRVRFEGQVPSGQPVREHLDRADLFVLPSRGEGLPRVLLEAMARSLPCIGTDVAGIPELLPADDLVPVSDVNALANKIQEVLASPSRMAMMSARNLEVAQGYHERILSKRRTEFYHQVRNVSKSWR